MASLRMYSATWAGVAVGYDVSTMAAAPAACGDAIEVPLFTSVSEYESKAAAVMSMPGAKRSRQEPELEKKARASVMSVAPTVRADATRAGE